MPKLHAAPGLRAHHDQSAAGSRLWCATAETPPVFLPSHVIPPLIDAAHNALTGLNRLIVPFVACGDLSGFDADMTYEDVGPALAPVQTPIDPPYKKAVEMKRSAGVGADRAQVEVYPDDAGQDDAGAATRS